MLEILKIFYYNMYHDFPYRNAVLNANSKISRQTKAKSNSAPRYLIITYRMLSS